VSMTMGGAGIAALRAIASTESAALISPR
jgi:hypothetical protein